MATAKKKKKTGQDKSGLLSGILVGARIVSVGSSFEGFEIRYTKPDESVGRIVIDGGDYYDACVVNSEEEW